MSTKKKGKASILSIMDAVETLSSIADMDFEKDTSVAKEHDIIVKDEEVFYKTVSWLTEESRDESLHMIKEVFRVVLDHLKNIYKEGQLLTEEDHTIEGIKTIMLLVGEAAKKLDKYTQIFYKSAKIQSITELKEFKDLQAFYQKSISTKNEESKIGQWILALSSSQAKPRPRAEGLSQKERLKTKYIFIDLETVKSDAEYELFFLRKEDGSRFFSPQLIRNMKLVSDFGNYFGEKKKSDPLIDMENFQNRCAHASAVSILRAIGARMERFFHETSRHRKGELAGIMNSAVMALLMSSHRGNLLNNDPVKSCYEYFIDFQDFIYQALQSAEYQKFLVYQPRVSNRVANTLLDTLHALCRGLIIHQKGYEEVTPLIQDLIYGSDSGIIPPKIISSKVLLSEVFGKEYELMKTKMQLHPNGPLILLLDNLEKGNCNSFTPLRQKNLPVTQFSMYFQEKKVVNIRLPAPVTQQFIDKAHIDEVFHGFLRACEKDHILRKHLIINLEDRTSWREAARCQAIEGLESIPKFNEHIGVVTLAFDSEFYHQLAPYNEDKKTSIFMEHFLEHLSNDGFGFYFPTPLSQSLFPKFSKKLMNGVHRVFFGGKNSLSQKQRRDFIEIYYFFLVLKVIEMMKPDSYSVSCKDGIDTGGSFNLIMYMLLKHINNESLGHTDIDCIHYMTYLPALFVRERLMLKSRFERFISILKVVEELKKEYGDETFARIVSEVFDPLYETRIIHSRLIPSHS